MGKCLSPIYSKKRHIAGKKYTIRIEQDTSNTRQHLGRMARHTKVVTKKEERLDASLKIWYALTDQDILRVLSLMDWLSFVNTLNFAYI